MPWMLALVPALSFGFLAAAPFIYLAVRRREVKCTAAAIVYSAACIVEFSALDAPYDSVWDNIGATLFLALMVIGTAHAFVWRETLAVRVADHTMGPAVSPGHVSPAVEPTAQTCARLLHTMAALDSVVAASSDFPPTCRRLLADTFAPINRVLAFVAAGGRADAQLRVTEAILDDYLPTSLHTYQRLPAQFASTHRNPAGRTADEELETQLQLIRDQATELATSLHDHDARHLQEQTAFLRAKFGRSELDLSEPEMSPD